MLHLPEEKPIAATDTVAVFQMPGTMLPRRKCGSRPFHPCGDGKLEPIIGEIVAFSRGLFLIWFYRRTETGDAPVDRVRRITFRTWSYWVGLHRRDRLFAAPGNGD